MIKAVIFDMDGVLIDSEIVYLRHQCRWLQKKYPWVTEQSLWPTVGMSGAEDRRFLAGLLGRSAADPDFLRELEEMYAGCAVYYPDILRPQVPSVLDALQRLGLRLALASSSRMKTIQKVLDECGIGGYFDPVVSGEQFCRSKPDPEIYHYTVRRLGCQPGECLVVEDSTYGVQAGAAAGTVVAALRDDRFAFDQSAARRHIQSLDELPALAAALAGQEAHP